MEDLRLVIDLVLAVVAAFAGGLVAQRLGQPAILGYLVAGVAIGPFTPGPTAELHSVQVLAEIGVAFLMFALGAEFSFTELRRMGRVAALGGALQIGGTMLLGPLLGHWLGLSLTQGIFLGGLLALSSTMVALKVLLSRGEVQSLHGRVTVGILIAQDLAVVPMVVVLPSLAVGGERLLLDLALAAAKAAGILIGAYVVGVRVVPWLLTRAAVTRSRELFLLAVVGLALGTALMTQFAGLSLAFGAFLAGMVVSESEYRIQVVAETLPLRDLFASLFFVSVGMLIDPLGLVAQAGPVTLVAGLVVLAKAAIVTVVVLTLGLPGRTALLAGLGLAQVGEFSFVLARVGVTAGAIPASIFDLTLAIALVTIALSPSLVRASPLALRLMVRLPVLGPRFVEPFEGDPRAEGLTQHAVICGFGRMGRELAEALEQRGLRYLVIDYNALVVREQRDRDVPALYGDAANPAVLEHAHLERARLLAILIPTAAAAEAATRYARSHHPRLDIVVRAADATQVERLRRAGATDVVQPEFEAALEVVRHALRRYGVSSLELNHLLAGRRATFYRRAAAEASTPGPP
ncbi:MAG TPA: cation:proton antiporter [Chloroflexota bacterium]|nr:cation:proton antiporter [Chloroflexota bacterium]